jgi:hypothetical protein
MCFLVFCEVHKSGDELTANGLVICSRGLNESYCVCVISGHGQADRGFILITYAMLPHNDGFSVITVAFIQLFHCHEYY